MDLIVRNVRLAERPEDGTIDIGVREGRIAAIAPGLAAEGESYDAGGRLACAGLVETHIHLDKSRLIDRVPPPSGRRVNPVAAVAPLKTDFTVEDIYRRAERTLQECLLNGATRMRTQVEVDPAVGLRGFAAIRKLAADYAWAIDLEICVFPQEGLTNRPGTGELLVTALKEGVAAVGGAPRYDSDPSAQMRRIFELAREFDRDIDIHLDVGDTFEPLHLREVCALTKEFGREGRVVAGHMAKFSLLPPAEIAVWARQLADLGIAVTVLPATDLYLMGRDRDCDVRRGVADANFLAGHGVTCSLSSNNILNPATPYGDGSLIRLANLYANLLQIAGAPQLRACFAMLTERSAALLKLPNYGLAIGNPADIVVIDAQTPEQAIAEIRPPLAVFKRGRRTVIRHPPELVRPAPDQILDQD
ncbi:MAG: amidohydrolase family protein [Stellaceae bacterium]